MWDERFNTKEYVYGTEANDFLQEHTSAIPKGRVLSLAEGEGRNAVFLAKLGYNVTAVDASSVGLRKAEQLANKCKVNIELIHADLADFDLGNNCWDGIISIFCPLPPTIRVHLHQAVFQALKPNGIFLIEAYRPEQIQYGTGGGANPELMQSANSLSSELAGLHFMHLAELEREVIEGSFHTGKAAVVQAIAQKRSPNSEIT